MVDQDGPFSWSSLDAETAARIHQRLSNLESMTWHEIFVAGRKQNHTVDISSMSTEAQRRLEAIQPDDVDGLVSLRVTGKERVWGIRREGHCYLLWWDQEHAVCPSKKKHT